MATSEDRSLSSGMSLPRWMKSKMNNKFNLEQNAFSPTEIDDSFMLYYRNSKTGNDKVSVSDNIIENNVHEASMNGTNSNITNHTLPCQKFIASANDGREAQKMLLPSSIVKIKSGGTDDGFKGEAAKCGSSVIRVAHQMIAEKVIKGFNIEKSECDSSIAITPEGFNPTIRRGSRSLPTSPLTSPKSKRRINRYFTGAFREVDRHHGNWILSNLLAQRQTLSQSVGHIAEEDEAKVKKVSSANIFIDVSNADTQKKQIYVPKPSELREMNCWSPTSM